MRRGLRVLTSMGAAVWTASIVLGLALPHPAHEGGFAAVPGFQALLGLVAVLTTSQVAAWWSDHRSPPAGAP